jgi:hypothetical protein
MLVKLAELFLLIGDQKRKENKANRSSANNNKIAEFIGVSLKTVPFVVSKNV